MRETSIAELEKSKPKPREASDVMDDDDMETASPSGQSRDHGGKSGLSGHVARGGSILIQYCMS